MKTITHCLVVAATTILGCSALGQLDQTSFPFQGYVVLKNGASHPVFFEAGHAGGNPNFTNTVVSLFEGGILRLGGEVKTTITSVPFNGSTEVRADQARMHYSLNGGPFTQMNLPFQFMGGGHDQWQAADGPNGGATVEIGFTLPVGTNTLAVYYEAVDLNFPLGGPIIRQLGSAGEPFLATIEVLPAPSLTVDGTAEAAYGAGKAFQEWGTLFGDNTDPAPGTANGSELDTAFAVVEDGVLYVTLGGNLESNGNELEIFFDTRAGGQGRLLPQNPNVNDFNNMADDGSGNGLRFSPGFEADFWIGFNGNGADWYADYLELGTENGYYLGRAAPVLGALAGGNNPYGVRMTVNNSNVAGVGDVTCPNGSHGCHTGAAEVRTGIELGIPLSALGLSSGPIKIFAIVNAPSHDFLSNQMLRAPLSCNPVPSSPPSLANLGNPRSVDLNNYECGNKWFEAIVPAAQPLVATASGYPGGPGGLTLSWNSLGAQYGYTVRVSDSPGSAYLPAPGQTWPISENHWTDTTASVPVRFYQIEATRSP